MIYLIGGPPRCGKTTVAKLLAQKLSIPWLSADTLESIVLATLEQVYDAQGEQIAQMFPKDVLRKNTEHSNDRMYSEYSAEQIARAYIKQAEASAVAIETLVACEISHRHDYIIEGHQIQPHLAQKIRQEIGSDKVRCIFLGKLEALKVEAGLKANSAVNDWAQRKTNDEKTFAKISEMITFYSAYMRDEALQYDLHFIATDDDFHRKCEDSVEFLIG